MEDYLKLLDSLIDDYKRDAHTSHRAGALEALTAAKKLAELVK